MRQVIGDVQGELLHRIGKFLESDPAVAALGACGLPGLAIAGVHSEPRAWILYDGEFHRLAITLRGSAAAVASARLAIAQRLREIEFDLTGQFVFDIALVTARTTGDAALTVSELGLEVLTIAD